MWDEHEPPSVKAMYLMGAFLVLCPVIAVISIIGLVLYLLL